MDWQAQHLLREFRGTRRVFGAQERRVELASKRAIVKVPAREDTDPLEGLQGLFAGQTAGIGKADREVGPVRLPGSFFEEVPGEDAAASFQGAEAGEIGCRDFKSAGDRFANQR